MIEDEWLDRFHEGFGDDVVAFRREMAVIQELCHGHRRRDVDRVCLVVHAGRTSRRLVRRACILLGRPPAGLVLNQVKTGRAARYDYYSHGEDYVRETGAPVAIPAPVAAKLKRFEEDGFRDLPVCIAKTQYSFSADPTRLGAPEGHVLPVREVRLSAGAGFVVAICGDVMTMPGLPRVPAAETIRLDAEGRIEGLF